MHAHRCSEKVTVICLQSAALNQQGVPVVQATSDFLTGNPVTSFVIDYLAADSGVQAVIAAMKSAAETAGLAELAFLVRRCSESVILFVLFNVLDTIESGYVLETLFMP